MSFFNRVKYISRFFASERLLVRHFIQKRCVFQQNVVNKLKLKNSKHTMRTQKCPHQRRRDNQSPLEKNMLR